MIELLIKLYEFVKSTVCWFDCLIKQGAVPLSICKPKYYIAYNQLNSVQLFVTEEQLKASWAEGWGLSAERRSEPIVIRARNKEKSFLSLNKLILFRTQSSNKIKETL